METEACECLEDLIAEINITLNDAAAVSDDWNSWFYMVTQGRQVGVFLSWSGGNGARAQVDGFPGNNHKKF
jgi:viroplasmin and RNaseH domain-containing protein